jgi:tetratricopeptide (TPR) repeat protein
MNSQHRKRAILMIAAVSALGIGVVPAMGQQWAGQDGRALDANNRVGSGGSNSGPAGGSTNVTPNDIVYRNVTGLRGFSGPVGSTDPRAFRGPTAGTGTDRFVAQSSGVPTPYTPDSGGFQPQPFYGSARGVPPPSGYQMEAYTGGYVQSNVTPQRVTGDVRTGNPFMGVENITMPQAGDMVLSAPSGSDGSDSLITASPLYGFRQWQPDNPDDQRFLQNFTSVGQLRSDVGQIASDQTAIQTGQPLSSQQQQQQPLGAPLPNAPLQPLQPPSQNLASPPLGNSAPLNQDYQNLTAAQQTPQYQAMHQRLEEFYKQQNISPEQAKQMADQQMQLRLKADQKNKPPQTPAVAPGAPSDKNNSPELGVPDYKKRADEILKSKNDQNVTDNTTPEVPHSASGLGSPIQVESLATGVKSQSLSNILKRAEELMKQGKFSSAIDNYKAALRLSPNNPLVLIGQANAELGGGYYTQAAAHLRQAYLADPTVAMGQFDIKKLIGPDRLTQVATDLKQIANKDLKSPAPVFLLSYIAYNTGSSQMASQWLDEAARRAGDKDPLFILLQSHWSFNTKSPATTK